MRARSRHSRFACSLCALALAAVACSSAAGGQGISGFGGGGFGAGTPGGSRLGAALGGRGAGPASLGRYDGPPGHRVDGRHVGRYRIDRPRVPSYHGRPLQQLPYDDFRHDSRLWPRRLHWHRRGRPAPLLERAYIEHALGYEFRPLARRRCVPLLGPGGDNRGARASARVPACSPADEHR